MYLTFRTKFDDLRFIHSCLELARVFPTYHPIENVIRTFIKKPLYYYYPYKV